MQKKKFKFQIILIQLTSNFDLQPISQYPACVNDLSFWIDPDTVFECNDFYDLVRSVAGDIVQQVRAIDTCQLCGQVMWLEKVQQVSGQRVT